RNDMLHMQEQYALLQKQVNNLGHMLGELEERDNEIYRTIFESAPLPDSIRYGKKYTGQHTRRFAYLRSEELVSQIEADVAQLANRIKAQQRSHDTLLQLVRSKEDML